MRETASGETHAHTRTRQQGGCLLAAHPLSEQQRKVNHVSSLSLKRNPLPLNGTRHHSLVETLELIERQRITDLKFVASTPIRGRCVHQNGTHLTPPPAFLFCVAEPAIPGLWLLYCLICRGHAAALAKIGHTGSEDSNTPLQCVSDSYSLFFFPHSSPLSVFPLCSVSTDKSTLKTSTKINIYFLALSYIACPLLACLKSDCG